MIREAIWFEMRYNMLLIGIYQVLGINNMLLIAINNMLVIGMYQVLGIMYTILALI